MSNFLDLKTQELSIIKEIVAKMKDLQNFYQNNRILNNEDLFHIEHSIFIWKTKEMKSAKYIEQIK